MVFLFQQFPLITFLQDFVSSMKILIFLNGFDPTFAYIYLNSSSYIARICSSSSKEKKSLLSYSPVSTHGIFDFYQHFCQPQFHLPH